MSAHKWRFHVGQRVVLLANVMEDWPEERGVVLEREHGHPGMYIVEVPTRAPDDDGLREVHEDDIQEEEP